MIDFKKIKEELDLTEGDIFDTFYGNGQPSAPIEIKRITDKSVFVGHPSGTHEHRESLNSVKRYLSQGLWKKSEHL